MSVKDLEITSIDAERFTEKGEVKKNVRIDHNSSVTKMKKVGKNRTKIFFRFTASYSGMGRIEIEGRILYEGKHPELAKKWRDSGEMPNEVANEIHSAVISHCIPEAVLISREIHLPPPIPLPKVNIPKGEKQKKPKGGMEVA
ncbi:MAG: hypothetical protein ACQESD_00920 [Thermoplasmatota archaeon]